MTLPRLLLPLALCGALGACSTFGSLGSAPTPAQTVAALDASYIASGTLAAGYVHLPRCGSPSATVICSDVGTVYSIREADKKAYAALTAATNAVRAGAPDVATYIAAAQAAVGALQSQAINLQVK